MAFRARIAQRIEIHRESRFPSLFPPAENRATCFDPRANPRIFLSPTYLTQRVSHLSLPFPLPCRPVLLSRHIRLRVRRASPFNLASGPIPLSATLSHPSVSRASGSIHTHSRTFFFFLDLRACFLYLAKHRCLPGVIRWTSNRSYTC